MEPVGPNERPGLHALKGWHGRGYLPHFDGGALPQSLTFRLADSLPAGRVALWREELASLPRVQENEEYRRRVEAYLDRGEGEAWLARPELARMVETALLHFDGERYRLYAWVVMPNHVHALLLPLEGFSLSTILHSWKSYTSREANRLLGRSGAF